MKLTAEKAREISEKNTVTEEQITADFIEETHREIQSSAINGSWFVWRKPHSFNDSAQKHFEELGFKVKYCKGKTMLDNDHWEINWESELESK